MNKISYGSNGSVSSIFAAGKPWIYPAQHNTAGVLRGGIPICFPFGASAELFNWPRHGVLRDTDMVSQKYANKQKYISKSIPMRYLRHPENDSKKDFRIDAEYGYEFVKNTFEMTVGLKQINSSIFEPVSLPSNLGLHPYFITPYDFREPSRATIVKIGDQELSFHQRQIEECAKAKYFMLPKSGEVEISIPLQGTIKMKLNGFTCVYVWRDSFEYICVEPVETPVELFNTERGSWLPYSKDGEFKEYKMSLTFIPVR